MNVKFFALIFALSLSLLAQLNVKTTEITISNFKADSTYVGPWLSLIDGENIDVTLMINDTSAVGYVNDSIAAKIGIQYGAVYNSYIGVATQTARGPVHLIDSVRSNRITTTDWLAYDSFPETYLDTSASLGYAINVKYLQPFVNELFRPVLVGLTGNELTSFLRVKIVVKQRKWSLAGKN